MAIAPKAPPTSTTLTMTISADGAISGSMSGAVKGPVSGTATLPPGPPGPAGPPGPKGDKGDPGTGIPEAPQDGKQYVRQNAQWVALSSVEPIPPEPIPPEPIPSDAKDFVKDFGAVSGTDCGAALQQWLLYARAHPGATLTIPAGDFRLNSNPINDVVWSGFTNKCVNATIIGSTTGVTKLNRLYMGSEANLQCTYDSAGRIQTVSAGTNSVVLVNASDAAKFAPGNWVMVAGLGLMRSDSYPLSFQYFEYRKIIGKSGNMLTLDRPLDHSYKSTWPLVRGDIPHSTVDYGGPGTIYKATNDTYFDNKSVYKNITVDKGADGYPSVFMGSQRFYEIDNCCFVATGNDGSLSPSNCESCKISNTVFRGGVVEVDKLVSYLEFDHCSTDNSSLFFQSASIDLSVVKNNSNVILAGVARVQRVENSTAVVTAGPAFFGACEQLTVIGCALSKLSVNKKTNERGDFEWIGNGTFRMSLTSPRITQAFQYAIPGFRWAIGAYQDGTPAGYEYPIPAIYADGTNAVFDFVIEDVSVDASYFYIKTKLTAPPPNWNYSGAPWSLFHLYGAKKVIASGNTGSTDLSYLAEPGGYNAI